MFCRAGRWGVQETAKPQKKVIQTAKPQKIWPKPKTAYKTVSAKTDTMVTSGHALRPSLYVECNSDEFNSN